MIPRRHGCITTCIQVNGGGKHRCVSLVWFIWLPDLLISHVQKTLEADKPGGTIVPVLISTDKTQLTLFRNKSAYPVYLTIGNIPKEIRRKPSSRAYVLLGYLPTSRLEGVTNASARRRQIANLYHACMKGILGPLEAAGEEGQLWASGDAVIRRCHPILAAFIGDYPEQVLVTCTYSGQCPVCEVPNSDFGAVNDPPEGQFRDLNTALNALASFDDDPGEFLKACQDAGIKPVIDPFWKDMPYCQIYRSVTPDVLHQMYQGVVKHTVRWVIAAGGAAEIDARCRRMPPNHNLRYFTKGISCLSRISGHEHEKMCRILLGLVVDLPLQGGASGARLVRCIRALLDLLFLAQLPVHTNDTLETLKEALRHYHNNKSIFVTLGIRDTFNIPKLHYISHYAEMITLYGTTDNFNTEYTERLHIDLAKEAYAATNRKDEFTQMAVWVERKEKVQCHGQFVTWRLEGSPPPRQHHWTPPGLELDRILHIAKHPFVVSAPVDNMARHHGATHFRDALARFVVLQCNPNVTRVELERRLWGVAIPSTVPVWHRVKFC